MTVFKGSEAIKEFLKEFDSWLSASVTVYLLGGSAMTVRGLKDQTEDIDLAVGVISEFEHVHESDFDAWTVFFDRFGIPTAEERQPADEFDGAIQIVLEPRSEIEAKMVDGRPVIPLQETVAFANEYYATFESALDILDRMYDDVDTDANYRMEPA
jgi:hypothetical protein